MKINIIMRKIIALKFKIKIQKQNYNILKRIAINKKIIIKIKI